MKICPNCGTENRIRAKFCVECGKPFPNALSENLKPPKASVERLQAGTLLKDRFEIIELINTGGMGYVYKGRDLLLKEEVAIKEMIDRFTDPRERTQAIERFRREADLLCKLHHPAIPKFLEYFVENQRYYLVMDYIKGLDLRKIIKRLKETNKTISLQRVIQWAIEICNVLEYLHSYNPPIVYRDLKPSNIIITPKGHVKLIDFGIARLFIPKIKATMVGTQGYAPPEQYRGEAEPRSDIYALGATLHHLLTGKDPQFEAPFHFEPIRKYNPNIPPSLEAIIDKALRLVPDDRFQTAKEFGEALAEVLSKEGKVEDLTDEIKAIKQEILKLKERKTKILTPNGHLKAQKEVSKYVKAFSKKETNRYWEQFRGNPFRNGCSPVPLDLQGRLKWRYKMEGKITASAVIDKDGNIAIGSYGGDFALIDPQGKVLWTFYIDSPIQTSAAIDKHQRFYVPCENGILYAITREGIERWRFQTLAPILSSPLVLGERIYIASSDGYVYSLDLDGNLIWRFNSNAPISSSPTAGYDGSIYIGNHAGVLYKIKPEGDIAWWKTFSGIISSTPAATTYNTIVVGCEDNHLYSVSTSGEILWKFKTQGWIKSSPAVLNSSRIYIGSSDHFFYALEKDGQEKWRFNAKDIIISSPSISDEGTIYFATDSGVLFALHPYGKAKWWFHLNGRVSSSPAIGPNGTLFIGSGDTHLYAIV